jgi:3-deoxy-manno-octulosonate cytidylyltransferase (CMP-KDO synthetase)
MNVLGIIPARYASTRLEGKPLVDLGGKTMIQRVYEQAKKALDQVIIATDDERIEKAVKDFGGEVIMTSAYHTTGTNRCLEAYEKYAEQTDVSFDVILNIQGDEPLLNPVQITSLMNCFQSKEVQMATLVIPTGKNEDLTTGVFVVFDKNYNAMYFSRSIIPNQRDRSKESWSKDHTFYKHVGMYGFTPEALEEFANLKETNLEQSEKLEQLRWLEQGNKIKIAITEHQSIAVDTAQDLEKVRRIIDRDML